MQKGVPVVPQPSRRPRIALISSSYHPRFGGVEEHTRHVASVLIDRGAAVEVWTVRRQDDPDEAHVDGVTVRYLPSPLPSMRVASLLNWSHAGPRALWRWRGAARRFRPDILHVHCFGPNGIYALVLSKMTSVPLLLSAHGETFMDDTDIFTRSLLMQRGLTLACRTSAAVTGCSTQVVDDLRERFSAEEVSVVPNGVARLDLPGRRQNCPQLPEVVAVGRLVGVKGFDLLLHAVALVDSPMRLTIVGDGPEREALEALAQQLGIGGSVSWVGKKSASQVQQIMSRGDVIVVPSRREAFGIVALEAWASGTPLVATSLGGPSTFVTDGHDGLLANPEEPRDLASKIERVLTDRELASRLVENGRKSVRAFTWERVVDSYVAIYRSLVSATKKPFMAHLSRSVQ